MPAVSEKQRRFFGAVLGRKEKGQSLPSDPKMPETSMKDFASKPIIKQSGVAKALKPSGRQIGIPRETPRIQGVRRVNPRGGWMPHSGS